MENPPPGGSAVDGDLESQEGRSMPNSPMDQEESPRGALTRARAREENIGIPEIPDTGRPIITRPKRSIDAVGVASANSQEEDEEINFDQASRSRMEMGDPFYAAAASATCSTPLLGLPLILLLLLLICQNKVQL